MNHNDDKKIHKSFWLISGLMFIWNLMGALNFVVQLDPEMLEAYRESEQMIVKNRPVWATSGFAIAVLGGAIGCVLLILRKALSLPLFIASAIGVLVAQCHSLSLDIQFAMGEIIGVIIMPIVVSLLLIWYARYCIRKGWLS